MKEKLKKNEKMKSKVISNNSGITLVSVVITIIVLLILAGVSIGLVFNSDGLFSKANAAATKYNQAKQEEADYLSNIANELEKHNGIYEGGASSGATIIPSPTPIKQPTIEIQKETTKCMAEDGEWYIPKGFKESKDSPVTIEKGKIIIDEVGNEWVWVPCYLDDNGKKVGQEMYREAIEYTRTDFGKQAGTYPICNETLDSTDSLSIKKYGGYYIGRYEAGADTQVSAEDTTRKVLIQKNKYPYNYITQANCVTKSKNFAKENNYDDNEVYTKLVSSYAWDTALNFIQKVVPDYAKSSTKGNYKDTNFISGEQSMNTGLTTFACNIYDMGGNLYEYTSESTSDKNKPCVNRGGCYWDSYLNNPAGSRGVCDGQFGKGGTFRITLYIK